MKQYALVGRRYGIKISDDEYMNIKGEVVKKGKRRITDLDSNCIPDHIRRVLDDMYTIEDGYKASCEMLEKAKEAKKLMTDKLLELHSDHLCSLEEFIQFFYNAIPKRIKEMYFEDPYTWKHSHDDNMYFITTNFKESNFDEVQEKYLILMRKCDVGYYDKYKLPQNSMVDDGIIRIKDIDALISSCTILSNAHRPLPVYNTTVIAQNYMQALDNKAFVYDKYMIPITEKYLTNEYAVTLSKTFFDK